MELLKELGWGLGDTLIGRKGSWNVSRETLRVNDLGEVERSTVLQILAEHKFPKPWEEGKEPYWLDKDWTNEKLENVGMMTRAGVSTAAGPTHRVSALGLPTGSKEYQKAYRDANRDKFRTASKKYQQKCRAALREKRKLEELEARGGPAAPAPLVDTATAEMQEKLNSILAHAEEAQKG